MKFITSVFVLLMFLSPLSETELSFATDTKGVDEYLETYELEQAIENQAEEALSSQIVSSLGAFMKSIGVNYSDVDAAVVVDNDKNISIEGIIITADINDVETAENIIAFSEENFGVIPRFEEQK